jgi:hypothetical protein
MNGSKVFKVFLILCIPSSVITHFLVLWFAKPNLYLPQLLSLKTILFFLSIGIPIGTFKSLFVSATAFFAVPRLRWWVILGSTVALSLPEAWIYYELWTWTFPFG